MTAGRKQSPGRLFVEFFISRGGSAMLALGTIVLVTRGTPLETAGVFIAATAYGTLLFSLLDLGTGPALVRNAANGDLRHEITVYIWSRAALTVVVVAVGAIGVHFAFPETERGAGYWSLAYVASSFYSVSGPIGQVLGTARPFRLFSLAQGTLVLVGIAAALAVLDDPGPQTLVAVYACSAVAVTAAAIIWLRPHLAGSAPRALSRAVATNLRSIAMLGLASGAGSIYLRADQSLVLRLLGTNASAYYGLAARLLTQARLVPATLQFAIAAFLAARLQQPGGRISAADRRTLAEITFAGGLCTSLAMIGLADWAVLALSGKQYDAAVGPALFLAVSLVPTFFNYVVGTSAIMAGRDKLYLASTLTALAVNIALNVAFLKRYGVEFAAATAVITELVAVSVVRARLQPHQGGLSYVALLACVAFATGAAVAKDAAVGTSANVWFSLAVVCLSGFLGLRAFRALRGLGNAAPHESALDPNPSNA